MVEGVGGHLRGLDAHTGKDLRVDQRQLDDLPQLPDLFLQPAHRAERHAARVLVPHVVHQRVDLNRVAEGWMAEADGAGHPIRRQIAMMTMVL